MVKLRRRKNSANSVVHPVHRDRRTDGQTDRQTSAKTLPLRFTSNMSTYGIASLHQYVSVAFNVIIIQSFNNHQISSTALIAAFQQMGRSNAQAEHGLCICMKHDYRTAKTIRI